MQRKPLPIGIEDFKELVDRGCVFADKTLMIKEFLGNASKVTLFTRPRRFGKTLNMSMFQRFFEKTPESNAYLFGDLKISGYPECMEYQGQYPVITLSLKGMKQESFEMAFRLFKEMLRYEFSRQEGMHDIGLLPETDRKKFTAFTNSGADEADYRTGIRFLSECLKKITGKNAIILIDEYDVPLDAAYTGGFYDQMISLIRSSFESALKTNPALEFAVLTGCLRVSRESIFTGFNNLSVQSVISPQFNDCFGFTQDEIDKMLAYYELKEKREDIKTWYDGYKFGNSEIYNPWSVINHISALRKNPSFSCIPYWANTSSNSILERLVVNADSSAKVQIEELMNGGTVETPVYEDVTYGQLQDNGDYIWSFLLFTGYLKIKEASFTGKRTIYRLEIPNMEVETIYETTVMGWLKKKVGSSAGRGDFLEAILNKDPENVNSYIQKWLAETISFYDEKENYYHGFMAGLLTGFEGYAVKSNREAGDGRFDIVLRENVMNDRAVVFEFKLSDRKQQLEEKADEAVRQIEEMKYDEELEEEGFTEIIKYGISFWKKRCFVKLSEFSG